MIPLVRHRGRVALPGPKKLSPDGDCPVQEEKSAALGFSRKVPGWQVLATPSRAGSENTWAAGGTGNRKSEMGGKTKIRGS